MHGATIKINNNVKTVMFNLIISVIGGKLWLISRAQKKNSNINDGERDGKDSNVKVPSREIKKQKELTHWPSSSHYNQAVLRSI